MQPPQPPNNTITTWKRLIALALPMAGTQFVNVASGFFCMTMLASLGHEVLAASALIFSTQLAVMMFFRWRVWFVDCMSLSEA